ncbi:MAG: fused response regulator/phosphatase [Acidobacteria bacterium]|nr:MAG: fused response regulator/phosphatase [Acidobacteriota bacterium]PYS15303.1 MAG: fused response regulator/phosphatase [Acidobacteriota bacterium]
MPFKVLVVDDEPDMELLIRQRFRRKINDGEFEFVFAHNGEEALAKLNEDPGLDVVMSDINMPVMDGLTLLLRLADIDRILKAVVVSAYGDMQNIRIAMNRGAYDFLIKPIDFQDFEVTLNKAIQELQTIKESLRAREQLTALQQELSVAARIQQAILPKEFPPFPLRTDFAIHARMVPAREVGGDFYDFFLLDKDRLGFVIGDVSGKGVPAAIFMAVCRTLLKATALQNLSAGDCLKYVNDVLVRQSDAAMFVTIFYGILHTPTGELEYCSGGHNPPYIVSPNGDLRLLDEPRSLIVGALEQGTFQTGHTMLRAGECILLFTDGVTEAVDSSRCEFSDARLRTVLEQNSSSPVDQIVENVISEVRIFSSGLPQADDVTVMALRRTGS